MLLVVNADANRGVSFAGKYFVKPKGIEAEIQQIKKQIPDIEMIEYGDFKGDWTRIDQVVIFNTNKVYPADKYFKFPANYRYLIKTCFNFAADGEVDSAEVFKRA